VMLITVVGCGKPRQRQSVVSSHRTPNKERNDPAYRPFWEEFGSGFAPAAFGSGDTSAPAFSFSLAALARFSASCFWRSWNAASSCAPAGGLSFTHCSQRFLFFSSSAELLELQPVPPPAKRMVNPTSHNAHCPIRFA